MFGFKKSKIIERDFKEENRIRLIKKRNEVMERYPKIVYEYISYTKWLAEIDKELGLETKIPNDVLSNNEATE